MRRHLFLSVLLALLVAVLGARCGGGQLPTAPSDEPATAQHDEGEEPPEASTGDPQIEAGARTTTPTAGATEVELPAGAEPLVALAQEDLARRLDRAPEATRLVSAEAVEWPDASLGCPQPGLAYAQVVTPGFLVLLEAENQAYEYHTDTERLAVLCGDDGRPVYPPIPVNPGGILDGEPWMP
jgi:hypothetical protein